MTFRTSRNLVAAAAIAAACAPASGQELSYRLPQATLVAGFQARLERCPTAAEPNPVIVTDAAAAGAYAAGELVRLNPRSPFLGSRSISLTFHENGSLKTINAEGEGKGGTILASLIKTGAGFLALGPVGGAAMAVQSLLPPPAGGTVETRIQCNEEAASNAIRWQEVRDSVTLLEADVVTGTSLSADRSALLERLSVEQADLEEKLTLTTSVKLTRTRASIKGRSRSGFEGYSETHAVEPIDYAKWFETGAGFRLPPVMTGRYGFCARFSASASALSASSPVATSDIRTVRRDHFRDGALRNGSLINRFVYFQPVPVAVELRERAATGADCDTTFDKGEELAKKMVATPQLSDYFILPLGAGAFESKSISAEFSPEGRIVSMGTKGAGGGTQFAEALAGALTGAETLRDAPTASIQRRVAQIKAEKELNALLMPSETSNVTEAP